MPMQKGRFLNERHVAEATSPGAGLYGCGGEHAETGATPRPVIDLDPTAMRQDDGLANRQPQPVTGHVRLSRHLIAEEWLKYSFAVRDRHARPLVLNREPQFTIARNPRRNSDRRARWRIFDRVLDQVQDDALHLTRIHPDRRQS